MHRCVVGAVKVDPLEVLGIRPDVPLPYWGWGSIPDQYGRRWASAGGELGQPTIPQRPARRLPLQRPDRSCRRCSPAKNSSRPSSREFEEPYFEFGVKFLPRRNDVVEHGGLEQAKAALIDAPILRASGEYGIVRRLTDEPGRWEIVPDATFDGGETA
jgi:hypothetical protein